jgi:hypothetical protein
MNHKPLKAGNQTFILIAAFFTLLAIVGFVLYGLPFFYDF